ncbi:MAG: beta-ketoacyl-ACP synthase III [Eubacteriales bacterium]|nr:beta-ketoacyl-ACP synthase III [Eubacteriales bacterium]
MGIINTQLIGTGSCIPDLVLTNEMLEQMVDTSDEWIVQRTGVRERRIAKNTHTWELALGAARNALADAQIGADELDMILVSTCTPDYNTPNTASVLQNELGARQIGAIDVNNACTGFISATDIADSYIKAGKARTVLVVSAETLHRVVDYTDRSTCILFGDGAAAAVYRATDDRQIGIQSTFIAADGAGADDLYMQALPVEDPFAAERPVDPKARFLKMKGAAVVRFTARAVPLAIDTALQRAGIDAEAIDWVVPHQANLRILDVIARRYHLPKEKIYVNLDRYGNTSSASVPICLDEMRKNGLLHAGQTIVCTGFGGGLTYGAFVLKL